MIKIIEQQARAELREVLDNNGYFDVRQLPDGRYIGLLQMLFTVGLCVDLDFGGYAHRYCYTNEKDAREAIREWDGNGHPPGGWVKRK